MIPKWETDWFVFVQVTKSIQEYRKTSGCHHSMYLLALRSEHDQYTYQLSTKARVQRGNPPGNPCREYLGRPLKTQTLRVLWLGVPIPGFPSYYNPVNLGIGKINCNNMKNKQFLQ